MSQLVGTGQEPSASRHKRGGPSPSGNFANLVPTTDRAAVAAPPPVPVTTTPPAPPVYQSIADEIRAAFQSQRAAEAATALAAPAPAPQAATQAAPPPPEPTPVQAAAPPTPAPVPEPEPAPPPVATGPTPTSNVAGLSELIAQALNPAMQGLRNGANAFPSADRFDPALDQAIHEAAANTLRSYGVVPDENGVYDLSNLYKSRANSFFIDNQRNYLSSIPGRELDALGQYKEYSNELNRGLRSAAESGDWDSQEDYHREQIANMDRAFSKAPGLPTDTALFRGIDSHGVYNAIASGAITEGSTYIDPAYMSTGTYKGITRTFSGPVELYITAPAGSRHVEMEGRVAEAVDWEGDSEREILLPRGSRFRVDRIENVSSSKKRLHVTLIPS